MRDTPARAAVRGQSNCCENLARAHDFRAPNATLLLRAFPCLIERPRRRRNEYQPERDGVIGSRPIAIPLIRSLHALADIRIAMLNARRMRRGRFYLVGYVRPGFL